MDADEQQQQRRRTDRHAGSMCRHAPGRCGSTLRAGWHAERAACVEWRQTGTPINGGADLGTTPGAFTPYGQSPPDSRAQPDSVLVNPDNPVSTPASSTPASTDGSQPQSPNGVSTPQQIYEQLQKLRQQQQTTKPSVKS